MIEYKETFTTNFPLYVHSYTSSIGVIKESHAKLITRAFPTHMTQFLFEFCGGLSTIKSQTKTKKITKRSYVNTGVGEWIDIFQQSSQKTHRDVKNFKVDLYPHTLHEIFNIAPKEIMLEDIRVEDIWNNKDDALHMIQELSYAKDAATMIAVFEHYFFKQILQVRKQKNYSSYFLQPHKSLSELSKELGYSKRWVQLQYKEIFGLSFKELQNNMRFLKVLEYITMLVIKNHTINLSLLAIEFGYYDQAHFIKEFKYYTGLTPSIYIKTKFNSHIKFYW